VKDGKSFLKIAKTTTPRKPILIWKVGLTAAGSRAASPHTGSLAGHEAIYNTAFRQSGVIQAHSSKGLVDFTIAFSLCKVPEGNRVGIISSPGGFAVPAADTCEIFGLRVLKLSEETSKDLKKVLPVYSSTSNPVDLTMMVIQNPSFFPECMKILDGDPNIDSIVVITGSKMYEGFMAKSVTEIEKPFLIVSSLYFGERSDALAKAAIPAYVYPEDAAKALAALTEYGSLLKNRT
jgi:acyl-CoA synthetase (NDP forming)